MLLRSAFLVPEKVLSDTGECYWKNTSFDIKTLLYKWCWADELNPAQHKAREKDQKMQLQVPVLWGSLLLPVYVTLYIILPLITFGFIRGLSTPNTTHKLLSESGKE